MDGIPGIGDRGISGGGANQADVGAIDSNHIQGGAYNQNAMDNGQAQYVGDKAVGNQVDCR